MLNASHDEGARDERGSIVIAMGVLMVLTMLATAVLARTLSTLTNVRRTQDFSAALASADGGMAEALFKLDQVQGVSFDNVSTPGTLGAGSYTYKATRIDDLTWTIKAKGVVNSTPHAIQATVVRDVTYPYAVFTNQTYDVNGNNGTNIYSYNSVTHASGTGKAFVGSNHGIEVNGGGTAGDAQHYYTPDGACTGCANGVQKKGPRLLTDPIAPTAFQACPSGGVFSGTINGTAGLTFLCNTNVTFSGTVNVTNGPVIVYVGPGYTVDMTNATINCGTDPGCTTTHAQDFRLLKAGTGDISARELKMAGVIYAPHADIPAISGGKFFVNGSVTVNSLRINGGPHFHVAYDDNLSSLVTQDWKVQDWTEIPSSSF
jgi:Tfp pilus assembly protein PilX